MAGPAYVGVFLDRPSRDYLLGRIQQKHPKLFADHITLAFGKSLKDKAYPIGKKISFRVWGEVWNAKGQAVMCHPLEVQEWLSEGQVPHITMSCANDVKPVYSNELIKLAQIDGLRDDIVLTGVIDYFPRTLQDTHVPILGQFVVWWRNFIRRF